MYMNTHIHIYVCIYAHIYICVCDPPLAAGSIGIKESCQTYKRLMSHV